LHIGWDRGNSHLLCSQKRCTLFIITTSNYGSYDIADHYRCDRVKASKGGGDFIMMSLLVVVLEALVSHFAVSLVRLFLL
jgi:hypothetical protein